MALTGVSALQVMPSTLMKDSGSQNSSVDSAGPIAVDSEYEASSHASTEASMEAHHNDQNDTTGSKYYGPDVGNSFILPDIEEDSSAEYDSDTDDECATNSSVVSRMSLPFVQFEPSIPPDSRRLSGMPVVSEMAMESTYTELGFSQVDVRFSPALVACVSSRNVDAQSEMSPTESIMSQQLPPSTSAAQQGRLGKNSSIARKHRVSITKIMGGRSTSSSPALDCDDTSVISGVSATSASKRFGRTVSLQPTNMKRVESSGTSVSTLSDNHTPTPLKLARQRSEGSTPHGYPDRDSRFRVPQNMQPTAEALEQLQGNYYAAPPKASSVRSNTSDSEEFAANDPSGTHGPTRKNSIGKLFRPNQVQPEYDEDPNMSQVSAELSHHSATSNRSSSYGHPTQYPNAPSTNMPQSQFTHVAHSRSDISVNALSQTGHSNGEMSQGSMSYGENSKYYNNNNNNISSRNVNVNVNYGTHPRSRRAIQESPPVVGKPENKTKARLSRLFMGNHVQADYDLETEIPESIARRISGTSSQGESSGGKVQTLEVELENNYMDGSISSNSLRRGQLPGGIPADTSHSASGSSRASTRSSAPTGPPYHPSVPQYQQGGHTNGPAYIQDGPAIITDTSASGSSRASTRSTAPAGAPVQHGVPNYQQGGHTNGPAYVQDASLYRQTGPQLGTPRQHSGHPTTAHNQGGGPQSGVPQYQQGAPVYQHGPPHPQGGPPQNFAGAYQQGQPQTFQQGGPSQYYQDNSNFHQGGPPPQYYQGPSYQQAGPPPQQYQQPQHYQQGGQPQHFHPGGQPQQYPPMTSQTNTQGGPPPTYQNAGHPQVYPPQPSPHGPPSSAHMYSPAQALPTRRVSPHAMSQEGPQRQQNLPQGAFSYPMGQAPPQMSRQRAPPTASPRAGQYHVTDSNEQSPLTPGTEYQDEYPLQYYPRGAMQQPMYQQAPPQQYYQGDPQHHQYQPQALHQQHHAPGAPYQTGPPPHQNVSVNGRPQYPNAGPSVSHRYHQPSPGSELSNSMGSGSMAPPKMQRSTSRGTEYSVDDKMASGGSEGEKKKGLKGLLGRIKGGDEGPEQAAARRQKYADYDY